MIAEGPMGHNQQLLFSDLLPEMPLTLSRHGMSLCPIDGVLGDRVVPDGVPCKSTCPEDVFSLLQNSNCFSQSQVTAV